MKYQLSQYQLFNIFCKSRDCEECPFSCGCNEEFYKFMELNYSDFKVEEN